jgi:hypothetical protein
MEAGCDLRSECELGACHIIFDAYRTAMLSAKRLTTIDSPWTTMQPVRLGKVPSGLGTADLFVTITDDAHPVLRVDLYGDSSSETFAFQDARVWRDHVFVGFGHSVYVVDPKNQSGSAILLGSGCEYFAAFYVTQEYLLVASGESLVRLSPDGKVLWRAPNLGVDGVVVTSVQGRIIRGKAECDPPGGWKPFALRLDTGELLVD